MFMKRIILFATALTFTTILAQAQLYKGLGKASFFSSTPVEDIDAHSAGLNGLLNPQTKEFAFIVPNTSFEFKNKLMQEHFNEKFMESAKYAHSTFKGKLKEDVDLTKNGTYAVTAVGKLNIHGVEKDRSIPATVTVKDGKIVISSEFPVQVKDHNIEIPKLVVTKVAEEIKVKVDTELTPKK
jgi:hypothetical protein